MTLETDVLCLCFAYVFLGLVLLTILTRMPAPRLVKIGAVVVVSALYLVVFFATRGLLGWSAPVAVPASFKVLWTRVVDPDLGRERPGAIHLWLEELDGANLPSGVPRAYVLPWSSGLASRVSAAQAEIEKGHPQGGRAQFFGGPGGASVSDGAAIAPPSPGAAPGGDPSGGGVLDPTSLGGQSKSVDLVPLPPPALPAKDAP